MNFLELAKSLHLILSKLEDLAWRRSTSKDEWGIVFYNMMYLTPEAERLGIDVSSWRHLRKIATALPLGDPKVIDIDDKVWRLAALANAYLIHKLSTPETAPTERASDRASSPAAATGQSGLPDGTGEFVGTPAAYISELRFLRQCLAQLDSPTEQTAMVVNRPSLEWQRKTNENVELRGRYRLYHDRVAVLLTECPEQAIAAGVTPAALAENVTGIRWHKAYRDLTGNEYPEPPIGAASALAVSKLIATAEAWTLNHSAVPLPTTKLDREPLPPSAERAWSQYMEAIQSDASQASLPLTKVYLRAKQASSDPDFPSLQTWCRYVRAAKKHHQRG
jgi:hypothetical protein